jgi:hypothetical protein
MKKRDIRLTSIAAGLAALLIGLVGSGSAAAASVPVNTGLPDIAGKAHEGQVLKSSTGKWQGTKPITFAYQWQRCNAAGGACQNIGGATSNAYTVGHDDVGGRLVVVVTATNAEGSGSAASKPTDVVKAAAAQAPTNTALPTIGGTTQQGSLLTASPGTWAGAQPITFAYRWQRCDAKGGHCGNTGIGTQTYMLGSGDIGHTLRVVVTAKNSAGAASATSGVTAVVQAAGAPPPPPAGACRAVATVSLPDQLVIDQVRFDPSRISSRSQPLVARFHVVAAKGGCVSGALVYAVGVPFDRLSKQAEVQTGGDGWATVTFRILPTFQLRRGNLVVVFVRARKPGESVLAGVSARRLVSVRVG